jgi:hypothetical protein
MLGLDILNDLFCETNYADGLDPQRTAFMSEDEKIDYLIKVTGDLHESGIRAQFAAKKEWENAQKHEWPRANRKVFYYDKSWRYP